MKKRIFISYSHKDKEWVMNWLLPRLEGAGIAVHIDSRDFQIGVSSLVNMERAVEKCDMTLLVLTPNWVESEWTNFEALMVQTIDPAGLHGRILPLMLEECELPRRISMLTHANFLNKENWEKELERLLKQLGASDSSITVEPVSQEPEKISLAKLPPTGSLLLGREEELDMLDKAWQDTDTHVLTLVAWGGVGKTALVNQWLNRMEKHRFRGAKRVYAWSFYSQGTSVDRQTSADEFIDHALIWFGDPDPKSGSAWDKGIRLANRVRETKTLLILDGMEPLQYPPGEMQGRLKDQALQALLKELVRSQPGLCVVTTRIPVQDIEFAVNTSVKQVYLENLTPETGAALLKSHGVTGTAAELAAVSTEFKGHALALNLLGRYLAVVHEGDIRQKDRVPGLTAEEKDGGHARRVMESYERFLSGQPELNILYMLGLFDRPADRGAMDTLRAEPPIDGLTTELQTLSEAQWKYALRHLRDLNLLAGDEKEGSEVLDCHPLVREHFGERFERKHPEAWKEAHYRLYEYYKNLPEKEFPDTLKEMEPLFIAVYHGCRAGIHTKVWEDVFWARILRGNEAYSLKKLGAFGSNLAALAGFFDIIWRKPTTDLNEHRQSFVLNEAGFSLRALGRLREAAQPMETALELLIKKKNWKQAAIAASNLTELYLTLGEVGQAVEEARKSAALADKSGDVFWMYASRCTLADALHQAGETTEAETLFRQAEDMQKKHTPVYPFLYSQRGYKFCDLLLGHGGQKPGAPAGRYGEVQKRANKTIKIAIENKLLLDIALDHLSLGRAHWYQVLTEGGSGDFTAPLQYLHRAVDDLREAGQQQYLPPGLLARAAVFRTTNQFERAWQDLEEAREIAERGSMNLLLADYHLEAGRLCKAQKKKQEAKEHFKKAAEMIEKMGYHRRKKEVLNDE